MIDKVIMATHAGFCFGVERAVKAASDNAGPDLTMLGDIIHNETVINSLIDKGVRRAENIEDVNTQICLIRSHGASLEIFEKLQQKGVKVIDATCPYVRKIHNIVSKHHSEGYQIVIAGEPDHPEVIGINGRCGGSALVFRNLGEVLDYKGAFSDKICVVAQTTFSVDEYAQITSYFDNLKYKTVVVFDTICYTTIERQREAQQLSAVCDCMVVIGSANSSNTQKLYNICKKNCINTYLADNSEAVSNFKRNLNGTVGIVAGASAPKGLILEVYNNMIEDNMNAQAESTSFEQLLNAEPVVNYSKGAKVSAEIISADEYGVKVKIGGKNDAFIAPENAQLTGKYDPESFKAGDTVEVIIIGSKDSETGLVPVSKKDVDKIKESLKIVEDIKAGAEFSVSVKVVDKGLVGRVGSYRVFVPQSHVQEHFIKDLSAYNNKKLRLKALEVDDAKKKIVASQKIILAAERKEKEDKFFSFIAPDVVVKGKVMRATPFGAFVDVGGFDCLCHITDLSWNKIGKVEDVLTIGEEYEFIVLSVDKEKKRVSLGYKQLHPHPFQEVIAKYPVGSTVNGKVVRLADFGAFVEIENGVTGLVHISEASHTYVKNINEALKAGDEITAKVTRIDENERKISLSIKAATPAPELSAAPQDEAGAEASDNSRPKKSRARAPQKSAADEEPKEWSEGASNTPFAELLKNLKS